MPHAGGVAERDDHRPVQRHRRRRHAEPARASSSAVRRQPPRSAACARRISDHAWRARAYRRAGAGRRTIDTLIDFYEQGRERRRLRGGIQRRCARVLVDPQFIFRFEREPPTGSRPARAYRISDLELASRLSFFLWSSIPDDELLDVAVDGRLHEPAVLEQQARRMLADPQADALVDNFAGQWLYAARTRRTSRPDADGLRRQPALAFQRETEMLFESIVREDRSVLDLLDADYTFVDERLARHYGIPNVRGSRFRRVALPTMRAAGCSATAAS